MILVAGTRLRPPRRDRKARDPSQLHPFLANIRWTLLLLHRCRSPRKLRTALPEICTCLGILSLRDIQREVLPQRAAESHLLPHLRPLMRLMDLNPALARITFRLTSHQSPAAYLQISFHGESLFMSRKRPDTASNGSTITWIVTTFCLLISDLVRTLIKATSLLEMSCVSIQFMLLTA